MWILTEDKTRIINTCSDESFFISPESGESYSVQHYRSGSLRYSTLGVYETKLLAITAIDYIFEALERGENAHAMF